MDPSPGSRKPAAMRKRASQNKPALTDDIAAMRGIKNGCLMSLVLWAVIGLIIYLV